ncbi:hypothetical protein AB0D11_02700 [Streptomyces monashensis]|uniref:hypothetical protein n=1 Tax=Streptomyces monashensis TaxID=1678012 RepID=UPI0033DB5A52
MATKTFWLDWSERVGATAGEAVLGVLITQMSSLPMWWAALLIPVLSAAKGFLARYVGGSGSASLLRRKASVALVPDSPADPGVPPVA